jgi:type II secretory pathway pseudopilin PulG
VPPDAPRACGVVVSSTVFTPAVPIFNCVVEDAPPENAVIVAVPLAPPLINLTDTWPLWVRASEGSMRPSVVVKLMRVPFWTGVPAPLRVVVVVPLPVPVPALAAPFSITVAMMVTSLFNDTVVVTGINEITVPVGASSGTLSHAASSAKGRAMSDRTPMTVERCVTIGGANNITFMSLRGQGPLPPRRGFSETGGYAMAALLVGLAVMAVLMSVALPVWRHEMQREKEEELVFRGQQYVRAIRLYQAKTQTLPPSIDVLVQGRYIRKKFKDPISGEDFLPIGAAGSLPGQGGQTVPFGRGAQGGQTGQGAQSGQTGQPPRSAGSPATGAGSASRATQPTSAFGITDGGVAAGGMMGVVSKSKDESIRLYQGRNHYNEWPFLFVNQVPGVPGGGRGQPGGPGGQGQPGAPIPQRGGRNPDSRTGQPIVVPPGGRRPGGL